MQHLDLETLCYLLCTTKALGPLPTIALMHQISQNSLTVLSDSPYA